MTDDKDFKQLVRSEARRTGRRYTDVRADKRPAKERPDANAMDAAEVADRFRQIVATIETHVFGHGEVVRLVALGLLTPGNVLVRGLPGNGMTALAKGVVAAIGGRLAAIDGRTGLEPTDTSRWRAGDVVAIAHFDGLPVAAQVAVVDARDRATIVLAKVHPVPSRMPFPPDDEIVGRFLFGSELEAGTVETELRILSAVRDGMSPPTVSEPAVDLEQLAAMRDAAAQVDVPDDVRRYIVEMIAAARDDARVLVGPSAIATLDLVRAAAAVAVSDGRTRATTADVDAILPAVLDHRVVLRE